MIAELAPPTTVCEHCGSELRPSPIVRTGPLVVDAEQLIVWIEGRVLTLTPHETRILMCLAGRVGQVCSHDDILSGVWGPEYIGEHHMLRVNVARLRAKLGPTSRLIETRPGFGYMLREVGPCSVDNLAALPWVDWMVPLLQSTPMRPLPARLPKPAVDTFRGRVYQALKAAGSDGCAIAPFLVSLVGCSTGNPRHRVQAVISKLRRLGADIRIDKHTDVQVGWVRMTRDVREPERFAP